MKRTKLLALTLVVAIMMVGAGYAAWTDTLQINHVVNTGYLDVHFVETGSEINIAAVDSPYMTGSVAYARDFEGGQNDWDIATATINGAYPGAMFDIQFDMLNEGTMPVKIAAMNPSPWSGFEEIGLAASRVIISYYDSNNVLQESIEGHPWDVAYQVPIIPVGGYAKLKIFYTVADGVLEQTQYVVGCGPVFKQFNK